MLNSPNSCTTEPVADIDDIDLDDIDLDEYVAQDFYSLNTIARKKYDALSLCFPNEPDKKEKVYQKLLEYRYIESENELQIGLYIRWIRPAPAPAVTTLMPGGILVAVDSDRTSHDNHAATLLTIKSLQRNRRVVKLKFEKTCMFVFQMISEQEKYIIASKEWDLCFPTTPTAGR